MDLQKLRKECLSFSRKKVKEAITIDLHIIQLSAHLEDLTKISNQLMKRLRDWYELILPEASQNIKDQEVFLKVIKNSKKQVMSNEKIKSSMGGDIEPKAIQDLRSEAEQIFKLKKKQESSLEQLMKKEYPNITTVAGSLIGAKLIAIAGSMKKLIEFPASTIQILGAEKALFRHLRSGAKPPKYGIILAHPFVAEAKDKRKAARHLADKISLAAKVDYFKGEFIGDKLVKQLK